MSNESYSKCLLEVQNALLQEWDPIGVKGIPDASGEYDSYAPRITDMVLSGKSKNEVFEFLWWLETEHMGLNGDRDATEKFSDRLVKLANRCIGNDR